MEQPPIQQTLQGAFELQERRHSHLVGVAGIVAALLVGILGMFAYLSRAEAAQPSPSLVQSASVETAINEPEGYTTPEAFENIRLIGQGAIVVDTTDNRTLFEFNPDAQLPLASLTKVPLMLAVSEVLKPDSYISMPFTTTPTTDAGIVYQGTRYTVGDLTDFMLVASSNEIAGVIASVADAPLREKHPELKKGSAAVERMQQLAKNLSLSQTFFINVTGLDESVRQAGSYGSARDMATLFTYASKQSHLFEATQQQAVRITDVNGIAAVAHNTNDALPRIPDLIMGKTGYTALAGGNLGVVFQLHGHTITAMILGSTKDGRFSDITKLVNATERYFVQAQK